MLLDWRCRLAVDRRSSAGLDDPPYEHLLQSIRPAPQDRLLSRQGGHARSAACFHSRREGNRAEQGTSFRYVLISNSGRGNFKCHNRRENRNNLTDGARRTCIRHRDAIRAQCAGLPANNCRKFFALEKTCFTLDSDLPQHFVTRRNLVDGRKELHCVPFDRGIRGGKRLFGDPGYVTTREHGGQQDQGGASCARFHALQDAKDLPLRDSPSMRNCGRTLTRRLQMGP